MGAMAENRAGGTINEATVADGTSFPEELTTRRLDVGGAGSFVVGSRLVSIRGSAMTQGHRHTFGPVVERDRHHTMFGEASIGGASGDHTWAFGAALQSDFYRSTDVPRFDYSYVVPALFAQDDLVLNTTLTVSGSTRIDFHNEYGASFNPRVSALLRLPQNLTMRLSTGTGVFAPTPFTEETEAVGLSDVAALSDLKIERGWSGSMDVGWSGDTVELNGSLFGSIIRNPIILRPPTAVVDPLQIVNAQAPTRTIGSEFLARLRRGDFGLTLTHTFIHSTESPGNERREVPLTPRHAAGMVAMWEQEGQGRLGVEVFYTGRQQLEENPFRDVSPAYWIVGVLAERRFGPARLFINFENLTNARQTRYDPLVRPQRHSDGRWTVDAWAPLEGRVLNGGIRLSF
jgi:iron complex outermembrane receptor protein